MSNPETAVYRGDSTRLNQFVPRIKDTLLRGERAKEIFQKRDFLAVYRLSPTNGFVVTRKDGREFPLDDSNWDLLNKSMAEHLADQLEQIAGRSPITVVWR